MFVVTGFALPIVLAHSNVIDPKACVMSITGGGWVTFKAPTFLEAHDISDWFMRRFWHIQQPSAKKNLIMTEIPSCTCTDDANGFLVPSNNILL